jgi:hypothetical protein
MAKSPTPTTYAGGLTRAQVVAWRNAIFAIFAFSPLPLPLDPFSVSSARATSSLALAPARRSPGA